MSLVGADMICPASEEIKGAASPDGVIWQEREDTLQQSLLLCCKEMLTCSAVDGVGVVEDWEEGGGKIEDSRWVGIRRSKARFCLKRIFELIVED